LSFFSLEAKHWETFSGRETGNISFQFEPTFGLMSFKKKKNHKQSNHKTNKKTPNNLPPPFD